MIGISPGDCHLRSRLEWFLALGEAGLRTLVVREPELDADAMDALVLQLWGVFPHLVIHDRHPRARRYHQPVHLPADGDPAGLYVPWSKSCHDEGEVDRALAAGASWVTLSPIWAPASKPDDTRPALGFERFAAAARGRPVVALGGVTPERARSLSAIGADFAVLGGLFSTPTPEAAAAACRAYLEAEVPVSIGDAPTSKSRSS